MSTGLQSCPRCGAVSETDWCDACERRISAPPIIRYEKRSSDRRPRRWRVPRRYVHLIAALLSLVLPGAGQVYKGRNVAGALWFVGVAACYWLVGLPALLVHLMCVVFAGSAAPPIRRPVRVEARLAMSQNPNLGP
jgi:hypothetical protein